MKNQKIPSNIFELQFYRIFKQQKYFDQELIWLRIKLTNLTNHEEHSICGERKQIQPQETMQIDYYWIWKKNLLHVLKHKTVERYFQFQ